MDSWLFLQDLLLSVDFVRTPRTGSCGLHGNGPIWELICTYWST
ncbi:unnamed protein product [Brassica oleracea var. botrytis]